MIARLEVWDPQDTVLLHSIQLDPMDVDEDHPYLVAKGDDVTWSRYHLSDVVVGVNIEEDTAWTGPLNVTCQVTSTERSRPEVTQSVLPSGLFEDLILFTATFNFSNVGDPADLDPQASLSCWASGMDDAGRTLQGATDLTASDPWFKATLTNEGPDLELGEVSLSGAVDSEGQTSWWPPRHRKVGSHRTFLCGGDHPRKQRRGNGGRSTKHRGTRGRRIGARARQFQRSKGRLDPPRDRRPPRRSQRIGRRGQRVDLRSAIRRRWFCGRHRGCWRRGHPGLGHRAHATPWWLQGRR